MNKIQDIDIANKKVLLRLDLNVPIVNGKIESDKRIKEAIPTIDYLIKNGASNITIISHLGEPHGKFNEKYSLWPIANKLAEILNLDAKFDKSAREYQLSDNIVILENLRFNPGEEKNDPEFAKQLSSGQDIFVNDAFGTMHREHASTVGITKDLPSYAGLLVQKEIENLEKISNTREKPLTIILGGAKINDKLPVLKNLTSRAQNFLIGGAIASTFLAARRHNMGKSLIEKDEFRDVNIIWQNIIDETDRNIYLPKDLVTSKSINEPIESKEIKTADALKPDYLKNDIVVDIGPETIRQYQDVIAKSKTIFWNGNMGVSEVPAFANGTNDIAKAIKELADKSDAHIVIGGGDTVAACEKVGITSSNNIFLSTGGGATLEYLAGKESPGLKALG